MLAFVGAKMMLTDMYKIPIMSSLADEIDQKAQVRDGLTSRDYGPLMLSLNEGNRGVSEQVRR